MEDKLGITDKILLRLIKKRKLNDTFKLIGDGYVELRRKDGSVIEGSQEEIKGKNIVNLGKAHVAKLLGGVDSVDDFEAIAIGTGTNAENDADTALQTEIDRQVCSPVPSYEADYKCVFERTFTFDSGEEYALWEAGLFDSATASGSTMLDRFKFASVKNVDADTDLYCKITLTVAG